MLKTRAVVPLLCASIVLAGCQVDTTPRTVASLSRPNGSSIGHAPWRGNYRLYSVPPNAKNALELAGNPLATVHLRKGDAVGFRKKPDGGIVAVAGTQEISIADGRYEWVMQADGGQTDLVKTTLLVVVIAVVVIGAIILVAVTTFTFNVNNIRK